MPATLALYAQRFLTDPTTVRAGLDCPVLVWTVKSLEPTKDESQTSTHPDFLGDGTVAGEPIVHELRKPNPAEKTPHPFTLGVTVGRTLNNDIVVPHPTVSRFHAYFQLNPETAGWSLIDAESKNGTYLNGVRLGPKEAAPLREEEKIRIGEVRGMYLTPAAFFKQLERLTKDAGASH